MELTHAVLLAVVALAVAAYVGFFKTKEPGFGRYNTSILLITTITFLAALLTVGQVVDGALFGHIVIGVLGFAGGLFVAKS